MQSPPESTPIPMSENPLEQQVGGNHYKDLPIQPVEFCQRNGFNYCESAAIKYIFRHRAKNGRQDIEKAIHYLQLLLELEYPSKAGNAPTGLEKPWGTLVDAMRKDDNMALHDRKDAKLEP